MVSAHFVGLGEALINQTSENFSLCEMYNL